MALLGFERYIYIDDVFISCVQESDYTRDQTINEYRVKERFNDTIKGIRRDQIDEQTLTLNISGLILENYSNDINLTDWLKSKSTRKVEIRYKDEIGAKNIVFNGFIESFNSSDTDLQNFTATITSTGEIVDGFVLPIPLFTFQTQKIGEINITTSGTNDFRDGNGNVITMPYTRQEGDSEFINMYGSPLASLTDLTAVNCQLIGDYDFTAWTTLQNANLEGNAFNSAKFTDVQFNTGTLNIINSFVQGERFTDFIIQFDTDMSTPRSSSLQVGTIDDPLLLDPGDTTGTYAAIQSLISKSWSVNVTANRLFTATIGANGNITPTAIFNGVGSVVYTLNGNTVSNVSNTDSNANTFSVNSNDLLVCYFSNNTNDISTLDSIECNDCNIESFIFDEFFNSSDKILNAKRNVYTQNSINILKSYLDFDTNNSDPYTSNVTVNINSLQAGNLYTEADYISQIMNYQNSDRLLCYFMKVELFNSSTITNYEQEGNFVIESKDNDIIFTSQQIKGTYQGFRGHKITGSSNTQVNDVVLKNGTYERIQFISCGITNNLDFSDITLNTQGFRFQNNVSINQITGLSGVENNRFEFQNCGYQGVLDLSNLILNTSSFIATNSGLTNVIFGGGSLTGNLSLGNCNLTGVLDLSSLTLNISLLRAFNNGNLTNIIFDSGTITNEISINNCDITGTLDMTNINVNVNDFDIRGNPNLTEIIVSNTSTLVAGDIDYDQTTLTVRKQDGTIILQVP